ncbi:uncharacterized protein [Pocillopora verrucosa]|uniref:uncharacterized protein isoform X4 n=1 Tax=Pocillopora verrucosa TaxID=203993 RepID=UPI002797050D|nr:uncharacterized protein LOC131786651 isoform X3 [Pocillopora verrucosa]
MDRMKTVMFSCTLPPCSLTRKEHKIARERERKNTLKEGKNRYNIVKGLAEGVDGISFESVLKKRHYLRARNNYLILEPFDDSEDYRKESTFVPLQDMWFEGYFAFESLLNPAHFIRRRGEKLRLQKYENSHFFKEDSSFKLTRKRCMACVKEGSRVWARAEKGCFQRGVVTAMDDDIHVQLENGKKIRHKKEHPECVVPDAVPHVREVDIGTRVLARWYNRLDTCYPGTVTAIRRSFFDIIFDDGDKGINELRELRILRKTEGEEDGKSALPPWSSLDGIPRIEGGLCIDYGDIITTGPSLLKREIKEKITIDYEICSTQDSPDEERVSSPLDNTDVTEITVNGHAEDPMENEQNCHQDENGFALENNYSYLTPDICETEPRNPSQVSGSSSDSGYQGNNSHRQRKIGVWRATSSQHNVFRCGNNSPQFLSPLSYLSHLHVPGLSDISDVRRNLSELSVTSSVDSGFRGSGHSFRLRDRSPVRCPGHAVPVTKVQENYWEKEKEQETEEEKQKIESTEDLNGEFHTGPLGLETVI